MGCFSSKEAPVAQPAGSRHRSVKLPPRWKSQTVMTRDQIDKERSEFWDTRVEGKQLIWQTLKAAVEASWNDVDLANTIIQSAEIIVSSQHGDLSECYDSLGGKYEIPVYVLRDPDNLA
eukprot:Rmarinus@m.2983